MKKKRWVLHFVFVTFFLYFVLGLSFGEINTDNFMKPTEIWKRELHFVTNEMIKTEFVKIYVSFFRVKVAMVFNMTNLFIWMAERRENKTTDFKISQPESEVKECIFIHNVEFKHTG